MKDRTLRKIMVQTGAAFAGVSVALGAIGAHLFKNSINQQAFEIYQTALSYQFYHALAIIIVAALIRRMQTTYVRYIFRLFTYGTLLFSGSLYIVALRTLIQGKYADMLSLVGRITPIGGLLLIAGWVLLLLKGTNISSSNENSTPSINNEADKKD
jgi:uncharacterized membrane protein YgdD (TMEM256/DUF423 family)